MFYYAKNDILFLLYSTMSMNCKIFGSKKHPCIVILHGWGNSSEQYLVLARLLGKNFYVLVPDLPGFGKTSQPKEPYSVSDYGKEVEKLLEEKKIKKSYIIGHSFGGRIAIKLAAQKKTKIPALILTGTAGIEAFKWKRTVKRIIAWSLAKFLKPFCFLPPLKVLRNRFYRKKDFGALSGIMKRTFLKVIREKLDKYAKQIECPTLLLWGRRDMTTPVHDAEKILKLIPNSYLKIFTRVGHRLPYEKPHEFSREVIQFFSSH
jgi:pimeloyl-ACP methyl ester carboxylesterase